MERKQTNLTKLTLTKLLKHGSSMVVSAIALLIFLVIINYLFASKTRYVDVTREKIHTLSTGTQQLLSDITFPVNMKVFYISRNQARINLMLNGYHDLNEGITFELIDPLKSPVLAQQYDITDEGTIIFEARGTTFRLDPPPPSQAHSEREITLMLYRILEEVSMTVYFTEGHGELSIDNPNFDGLSTVRDRLLEQGYLVKPLNLQTVETVDPDESIVVICEPKTAFADNELDILLGYMYQGGNLVILNAPSLGESLQPLIGWHGVAFGNDFIYETSNDLTTQLGQTAPLCKPATIMDITRGLENQHIIFPMVSSIEIFNRKDNVNYIELMASSGDSWAETDIESALEIRNGVRPTRDEQEQRGPLTVAIATETEMGRREEFGDEVGYRSIMPRSAFFGNARFISNTIIAQFPSNLTLFVNTINWISGNEDIIEITPNAVIFTAVELSMAERSHIFWITTIIFPALIIAAGAAVWIRKR